jgi:hypothetical protein
VRCGERRPGQRAQGKGPPHMPPPQARAVPAVPALSSPLLAPLLVLVNAVATVDDQVQPVCLGSEIIYIEVTEA